MDRIISVCIDFILPPSEDVQKARAVPAADLLERVRLSRSAEGVYSALPYSDEAVRAVIRANKFHSDRSSARKLALVLEELLHYVLDEYALENARECLVLVPTPTSPKRARQRGRHQVKAILTELPAEVQNSFIYADVLSRGDRESQLRVPKEKRHANIAGAFYIPARHHALVSGKTAVIIDDVSESGATMADMTRALKEAGTHHAIGVALAH